MNKVKTRGEDRIITGVCSALAGGINVAPVVMRGLFIVLGFFTAWLPMFLVYLLFTFILPDSSGSRALDKRQIILLCVVGALCVAGVFIARAITAWINLTLIFILLVLFTVLYLLVLWLRR